MVAVAMLCGCGKSQPGNPAAAPAGSGVVTELGTGVFQPNTAASPAPPAAAMPPATASAGAMPAGPVVNGAVTSGPEVNGPAVTGSVVTGPAVTGSVTAGPATTVPDAMPAGTSAPGSSATPSVTQGDAPSTAALASGDMPALAAAANQWRLQGGKLAGVKRFQEKSVVAGYSWMIHLLPYLGHSDLYNRFDFNKGWHEEANVELTCQVIPAFIDPSNPNRNMRIIGAKDVIGPAFTHYVGMAGIEDSRNLVAASLPRSDPRAGIFGYDQIARPEEITDGASNTLMLVNAGKIVGPWASGGGGTVRGARAPYFDPITGFGPAGDPGGGAVVALADGSVRRISKDIDPAVFRALCTIHGGETVDLPAQ
ncbi:MAG: hypothetical protein B7Z73_14470 [Planctomycetia bacterium 21-64-5]|nr:MAG: hypothetical protein B7Z73_14470 [Planctomycetia bacterium 21-64-5]